ncbi:MAG: cupin domain-containing protein [Flavobacterium sp.]|nr:MAG: cupin domain-containing protein [Flavobacterium sp.]
MNRQRFITSIFTLSIVPVFASFGKLQLLSGRGKGFKVPAGEARSHGHLKLKGVNSNIIDVKISGDDTDGDLAIFEQTSISQGRGTPLHVHHSQDEIFYVLEGSYKFQVGTEKYDLTVGDSIFLPRKVPHAWMQVSKTGKMTITFQPAGKMENFFLTISSLDHEPSASEMAKMFEDNEMTVVGKGIE